MAWGQQERATLAMRAGELQLSTTTTTIQRRGAEQLRLLFLERHPVARGSSMLGARGAAVELVGAHDARRGRACAWLEREISGALIGMPKSAGGGCAAELQQLLAVGPDGYNTSTIGVCRDGRCDGELFVIEVEKVRAVVSAAAVRRDGHRRELLRVQGECQRCQATGCFRCLALHAISARERSGHL